MKIRSAKGFTLVELIVAVTLTAVVIGGACSVFYLVSSSYKNGTVSASSQQKALLVEEYLRKYAATARSIKDSKQDGKDGATFLIAGDTLTIGEHTTTPLMDNTTTIDGIRRIDFNLNGANLNYTISFPDTDYTFQGGIVMNNFSDAVTGVVCDGGQALFLGKSS